MVLTSSGEVLTNNHVISRRDDDQGRRSEHRLIPTRHSVVGYSRTSDVAVLQLQDAPRTSKTVSTGDFDDAQRQA
jgi:S1-C subfamily serine protease